MCGAESLQVQSPRARRRGVRPVREVDSCFPRECGPACAAPMRALFVTSLKVGCLSVYGAPVMTVTPASSCLFPSGEPQLDLQRLIEKPTQLSSSRVAWGACEATQEREVVGVVELVPRPRWVMAGFHPRIQSILHPLECALRG